MIYLTVYDRSFLLRQSNSRSLRVINVPAYRSMILDRNNQDLAVTVPTYNVWVNPQEFSFNPKDMLLLSKDLDISPKYLSTLLKKDERRQFVYLRRDVSSQEMQTLKALKMPGIYLQQGHKRYYSQGALTAQVLGFTNIDNQGEEGLELKYNNILQGRPGRERVIQDRHGNVISKLGVVKAAKPGHQLVLSLDERIQYLAYDVLKDTVQQFDAQSGSVVVLDPRTGEVLAMVNEPDFDPNIRGQEVHGDYRNRAVTDMFEPGSTMKTFTLASALTSGKFTPDSRVDTDNSVWRLDHHLILDDTKNGDATLTTILQKSSNIGAAKLALASPPEHLVDTLKSVGFGHKTASGFPGESPGLIPYHRKWGQFTLATLAFGYGVTATPLQIAHAYSIIANGGKSCPVTFLKRTAPEVCPQVMEPKIANDMLTMLQAVMHPPGTGVLGRVPDYSVAGKTGTAYIAKPGGYDHTAYMSSFVGIAPASNPQLLVFVDIRKPQGEHFGATVAAPAFAKIMAGALRILNIPPDDLKSA